MDEFGDPFWASFPTIGLINHTCVPNAEYWWDHGLQDGKSTTSDTPMQERKSPSTMGSAAGSTRARTSSVTSWQKGDPLWVRSVPMSLSPYQREIRIHMPLQHLQTRNEPSVKTSDTKKQRFYVRTFPITFPSSAYTTKEPASGSSICDTNFSREAFYGAPGSVRY
jgi:hypothetical protein